MLVAIRCEPHNVTEKHTGVFNSPRLDRVRRLQFLDYIPRQNNVEKFFGAFLFFLNLAEVRDFAIPQAFFLQARPDACAEENRIKGFGNVIFRAQFDAAHDSLDLVEGRNHDDWDIPESWVSFHSGQNFAAVQARHEQIEQHQIKLLVANQLKGFSAVWGSDDFVAELLQTTAEEIPVWRIIVGE